MILLYYYHSDEHLGGFFLFHNVMVCLLSFLHMSPGGHAQESCKVHVVMRLLRIEQRVPGVHQNVIRAQQTPSPPSECLPASSHISQAPFLLSTLNSFPFCCSPSEPMTNSVLPPRSLLISQNPKVLSGPPSTLQKKPRKELHPPKAGRIRVTQVTQTVRVRSEMYEKNKLLSLEAMSCSSSSYGSQCPTVIKATGSTCFQSSGEWWPPPFQSIWTD